MPIIDEEEYKTPTEAEVPGIILRSAQLSDYECSYEEELQDLQDVITAMGLEFKQDYAHKYRRAWLCFNAAYQQAKMACGV